MCSGSGSKDTSKSNSSSGTFKGYTANQIKGFDAHNFGGMMLGLNSGAASAWANGKAGGLGGGKDSAVQGVAGAQEAQPDAAGAGTLMQKAGPRMTGVFGPTGLKATKETEDAFAGSWWNPSDGAKISVSDDIGWDFSPGVAAKDRLKGTIEATSRRGLAGSVRDAIFGYDRTVTPKRAAAAIIKGPGELKLNIENLGEGNRQYEDDKLTPDYVGMAIDGGMAVVKTAFMGPFSAVEGIANFGDTLMDHHATFGIKSASPSTASSPTAQRVASGVKSGGGGSTLDGEGHGRGVLMQRAVPMGAKEEVKDPVKVAARKVRRGKKTLSRTGADGVTESPNILMQRLGR